MVNDSTVVGECCFFGGAVYPKVFLFAINTELCLEPLPSLDHSNVATGVVRFKCSFLFLIHDRIVIRIIDGQSIGKI